jgi:hypothetical protein
VQKRVARVLLSLENDPSQYPPNDPPSYPSLAEGTGLQAEFSCGLAQ